MLVVLLERLGVHLLQVKDHHGLLHRHLYLGRLGDLGRVLLSAVPGLAVSEGLGHHLARPHHLRPGDTCGDVNYAVCHPPERSYETFIFFPRFYDHKHSPPGG